MVDIIDEFVIIGDYYREFQPWFHHGKLLKIGEFDESIKTERLFIFVRHSGD